MLICTTIFTHLTLLWNIGIDNNLPVRTIPVNSSFEVASVTMGKDRVDSVKPGVPNDCVALKDSKTQWCISLNTLVLIPLKISCKNWSIFYLITEKMKENKWKFDTLHLCCSMLNDDYRPTQQTQIIWNIKAHWTIILQFSKPVFFSNVLDPIF